METGHEANPSIRETPRAFPFRALAFRFRHWLFALFRTFAYAYCTFYFFSFTYAYPTNLMFFLFLFSLILISLFFMYYLQKALLRHAPNDHSHTREHVDLRVACPDHVPLPSFALRCCRRGRSRHRGLDGGKVRDTKQIARWCRGRGASVAHLPSGCLNGCSSCLAIQPQATPFDGRRASPWSASPNASELASAWGRIVFVRSSGWQIWSVVGVCRIQ